MAIFNKKFFPFEVSSGGGTTNIYLQAELECEIVQEAELECELIEEEELECEIEVD